MFKHLFHTCKAHYFFGGIAALLVLTHLSVGFFTTWLSAESTDYSLLARNLLTHDSFRLETGYFAAHHPPLFPITLALYYGIAQWLSLPELWVCSAGAIAWLMAAAYQAYASVKCLWHDEKHARLAALFLAFQPFVLYASFSPLSEIPFVFFLMLGLRYFLRYAQDEKLKHLFILALSAGAAMLCRSVFILGPLFLLVAVAWVHVCQKDWKKAFAHAGMALGLCLLVVSPWSFYASAQKNQPVFLSSSAMPGIRDGLSFNHKKHRENLDLPPRVEAYSDAFWDLYPQINSPKDWLQFIQDQGVGSSLLTYSYKALRCWYGTDSQNHRLEQINALISVCWLLLFFVAVRRIKKQAYPHTGVLLIVAVLSLYFWGLATIALSIVRYMVPVFALMALYIPAVFLQPVKSSSAD